MNIDVLKRWAVLYEAKKAATELLDDAKAELKAFEEVALEELMAAGVADIRLEGHGLCYMQTRSDVGLANGTTKEDAIKFLDQHGHGDIAARKVTTTQLSALRREYIKEEKMIPPEWDELFVLNETTTLRLKS